MNCESCKTTMNDTTTEMEISIKGRTVKALNVPTFSCSDCNEIVVDQLVQKIARTYAKGYKEATFDYKEVNPRGAGITFGKS